MRRLWQAVPAAEATSLIASVPNPMAFLAQVRAVVAAIGDLDRALPALALRTGADWLASGAADQLISFAEAGLILGHGDPNLANFLWDGAEVRVVDFEDSGPSCRAYELALLAEHISAWSEARLDADAFTSVFDLTTAELTALREYRRLAALYWLAKFRTATLAGHGTDDGTLNRQADRLLTLLGCSKLSSKLSQPHVAPHSAARGRCMSQKPTFRHDGS